MGDLECGFEEMQGVKLGYLVIQGKQMFALSQVFTDLLKNIPRTTVHKRMDHLNVKKHHCDLEELRKLKAINSIAFHAAKCTLISREDVEALYVSCKTERVLKSNKRKARARSPGDAHAHEGLLRAEKHAELWRDKVWFSLHGVPQTLSLPSRRDAALLPDSKLPQFYSRPQSRNHHSAAKPNCKAFKNYETAQVAGNCVAFKQRNAFCRSAVHRQPVVFQSAMESRLSAAERDPAHKRKRRRGGGGRSRHTHHPPVLLVQPKCCSKPKSAGTLNAFHLGHDFYLDTRPHNHHHHHHHQQSIFHESYSSDTESSTYSDRANNDSDFGSSISTSSNSGSSDEEDEDDSPSESSEVSSDEESSTQSDSSSVSSQVSVQSIRYRRARVASLTKSFTGKTPLVLQPTFHYNHQQEKQPPPGHGDTFGTDFNKRDKGESVLQSPTFCATENLLTEPRKEKVSEALGPKTPDPVDAALCLSRNKAFPPRRGPAHKSPPTPQGSNCEQEKDCKPPKPRENHPADARNGAKATNNPRQQPSPLRTVKTEADEPSGSGLHSDGDRTPAKASHPNFHSVKVKVEDSYDEYEYWSQASVFQCKGDRGDGSSDDLKPGDYFGEATESAAPTPGSPTGLQECGAPQDTPRSRERDWESGAPARKPPRTQTVHGKKNRISRPPARHNVSKGDKDPCFRPTATGAAEVSDGFTEDLTGASKRKRPICNIATPARKAFSFMANFPSPPSLVVGSDGDLCPAYSMNSLGAAGPPPPSHPVWRWQPGGLPLPPPPAARTRKC